MAKSSNKVTNGIHVAGIEFKDGKRSVIEVDNKKYKSLVQSCF